MSTEHPFYSTSTVDDDHVAAMLEDVVHAVQADPDALPASVTPEIAVAFTRSYYSEAVPEDVVARSVDDLAGIARGHLATGVTRVPGAATVSARSTSMARAAVDIIADDIPFLVDSVTGEILRRGYTVRFLVHPVLDVDRDRTGRLTDVLARSDTATAPESWIHLDLSLIHI